MEFRNKYHFLSNFYACLIRSGGYTFTSAEHVYQASKSTDDDERALIARTFSAGEAKKLGRKITLRSDFHQRKVGFMKSIVKMKFEQNLHLAINLINTGKKELIEDNFWHDNFWGNCLCAKCKNIDGQNMLGRILMEVRSGLPKTLNKRSQL